LEFLFAATTDVYFVESYPALLRVFLASVAAAATLCLAGGIATMLLGRFTGLNQTEGLTAGVLGATPSVALYQQGATFPGGPDLNPLWLLLAAIGGAAAAGLMIRGAAASLRRFLEAVWPAVAPVAGWSVIVQAFHQYQFFPGRWIVALLCIWILGTAAIIVMTAKRPSVGHALTGAGLVAAAVGAFGMPVDPNLTRPGEIVGTADPEATPVILLTVDTLRRDALSFQGGPTSTPAIDALAADSVVFSRAYSTAPWTWVSFPSILSGLTPWAHGVRSEGAHVPLRASALAPALRDHGYVTGALGENGLLAASGPVRRMAEGFGDRNFYPRTLRPVTAAQAYLRRRNPDFLAMDASTDDLGEFGSQWVRTHKSQPFLLWLHFFDPHSPYERLEQFPPSHTPPESLASVDSRRLDDMLRQGPRVIGLPEWARALYQAEVQHVDQEIGEFLEGLKHEEVYDRALIVFTSDHGEEFAEHNDFHHGHSLYEELVRVPLMVKLPHSESVTIIDRPVSTVAIMPTILDLTSIPYNPDLYSARSLRESWQKPVSPTNREPWPPVYMTGITARKSPAEAVVWNDYKYIRWTAANHEELYALEPDPTEQHNLASHYPELVALGRVLLEDHAQREARRAVVRGFRAPKLTPLTPAEQELLRSLGYLQ
jgi:arylsulfatase